MKKIAFTFIFMMGIFIRAVVTVAKTEVSLSSRFFMFLFPCFFFSAIIAAILSMVFDQDDTSMGVIFFIVYAILMAITVFVI